MSQKNKEDKLTIKSGTKGPQIRKGMIKLTNKAHMKLLSFKKYI